MEIPLELLCVFHQEKVAFTVIDISRQGDFSSIGILRQFRICCAAAADVLVNFDKNLSILVKIQFVSQTGKCSFQGGYGIFRKHDLSDICNLEIRLFFPQAKIAAGQITDNSKEDSAADNIPFIVVPPVFHHLYPSWT